MRSCLCNHQGSPTRTNFLFVPYGFVFFFLTRTKTHVLFPPPWCCSWIDIIKRTRTLRFLLHFFRVKPDKVWRWWCWAEWEYEWDGVTRQALFSSSLKGITLPSFLSFFLASHWILYFLLTYLTASLFSKLEFIFTWSSCFPTSFQFLLYTVQLPLSHRIFAPSLYLPLQILSKTCPCLHSPPSISVFWTVLSL